MTVKHTQNPEISERMNILRRIAERGLKDAEIHQISSQIDNWNHLLTELALIDPDNLELLKTLVDVSNFWISDKNPSQYALIEHKVLSAIAKATGEDSD
jgi:hypothetical protein